MKFLLDAGHGGILLGHYLTPGKRSPEPTVGIYEGEFNRSVARYIELYNKNAVLLNPGPIDIPRRARCTAINKIVALNIDICSTSIHANAASKRGWSNASGFRIFYPKAVMNKDRREKSKKLAEYVSLALEQNEKIPYGEREPMTASFDMLAFPKCPAILVECGFMDNREEAIFMASPSGQSELGRSIALGQQWFAEDMSNV